MPNPTSPIEVMTVLADIVRAAADAATDTATESWKVIDTFFADHAEDVVDDIGQMRQIPNEAVRALRNTIATPDWTSLLVFWLLRVHALDQQNLRVGLAHPPGWSRMVTLGYAPPGAVEPHLVVGLGVIDGGRAVKHPGSARRS